MYSDVELIWQNCHSFNESDSEICTTANEAQQAFHDRWQQQGLPQQQAKPGKKKTGKSGKQAAATEADNSTSGKKKSGKSGKQEAATEAVEGTPGQKRKGSKVSKQAAGDAPNSSAKADAVRGKTDKAANRRESQDGGKSMAAKPQQTAKRKRGDPADDDHDPQPSKKIKGEADQQNKKSKGASDQHLAPEKLSASARLRKGLPPTPPLRVSPRAGNAEAAADESGAAGRASAAHHLNSKAKGKSAKGKFKGEEKADGGDQHAELEDGKTTEQLTARRISGRLK